MLQYINNSLLLTSVPTSEQFPHTTIRAYFRPNVFRNFENWGISVGYSPVLPGDFESLVSFRPMARERKYLMDYNN